MLTIEVTNAQSTLPIDRRRIKQAVAAIVRDAGCDAGEISIAVVDDPTIRELNANYLQHDYATDVLSFLLGRKEASIEGEVVVSSDTAAAMAPRFGWNAADELLLYVIHGTLHLVGEDDTTVEAAQQMRERERHYLRSFGLDPQYIESRDASAIDPVIVRDAS